MRLLFVIPCDSFTPSGVVRVRNYLPYLDRRGVSHTVLNYFSPLCARLTDLRYSRRGTLRIWPFRALVRLACRILGLLHQWTVIGRLLLMAPKYDAVFLQWVVPSRRIVSWLNRRARKLIYDFDDAVFLNAPQKTDHLVRNSWCVIAGSHFLYEYAELRNRRVVLIPSAAPVEQFRCPARDECRVESRPFRIGWIGSPSTVRYLEHLKRPAEVLRRRGRQFVFVIAGAGSDRDAMPDLGPMEVVANYRDTDIPKLVASMDIGVMPLSDTAWEQGKCAMKAVLCMAGGKPVVCSRVGESVYLIEDGVNGLLAASPEEWVHALEQLMSSESLRRDLGVKARQTVEASYSTETCFRRLEEDVLAYV
jgi:glycosyltransferase involved in cell wall biosynthesis